MKAASLFEILVVIGIFSILVVLTFPFSLRLMNQSKADAEAKALSYMLFRQQQDAYSGFKNKPYGIALYSDRYTIFTGNSLATAEYQDTYFFPEPITVSSISLNTGNELVFPVNSFRPSAYGYLLVSDSKKSYRIDLTSEGLISYYGQ